MKKTKKQPGKTKQLNLNPFAGQWVVILGNKVIAHSNNLDEVAKYVVKDTKDRTPLEKLPYLSKVPHPDEGPYVLVCLK